ncbi:hypothetical protein BBJ29_006324 [Phytophthora kernoviae]|uniref:Uncharacterized protein n=1 Tax=Phytophthora kernoviae TaxID=325452 RepID=A0A3F2RGE4_9STRA|nr:hypothetical protein BBJ29_006324 [Phytophthora kernoviae]RLN56278.1 hypothetical protein BBP00_00008086 [Phytophthora kernoviae]
MEWRCNNRAMEAAAFGGHFDILDFLHRKGLASCTPDVSIKAVAEGHLEILEWLFLHYPEPIQAARLLRIAKRHDLYCVDWLQRTGKAIDYDM